MISEGNEGVPLFVRCCVYWQLRLTQGARSAGNINNTQHSLKHTRTSITSAREVGAGGDPGAQGGGPDCADADRLVCGAGHPVRRHRRHFSRGVGVLQVPRPRQDEWLHHGHQGEGPRWCHLSNTLTTPALALVCIAALKL